MRITPKATSGGMPTTAIRAAHPRTQTAAITPIHWRARRSSASSDWIRLLQWCRALQSAISAKVIQAPAACSSRYGKRAAAVPPVSSPYITAGTVENLVTSQKNQQLKLTLLGTK